MKNGTKEMKEIQKKLGTVKTFSSLMITSARQCKEKSDKETFNLYLKGYLVGRSDEREAIGRVLQELLLK